MRRSANLTNHFPLTIRISFCPKLNLLNILGAIYRKLDCKLVAFYYFAGPGGYNMTTRGYLILILNIFRVLRNQGLYDQKNNNQPKNHKGNYARVLFSSVFHTLEIKSY